MPSTTGSDRIYKFGEFRLLTDDRMLLRGNERVPMSPRVFDLLRVLIENAGRLISKETLMKEVWVDSFVEESNLNQTVSRLRKALGETPEQSQYIETIPRVGYRFIADVEVVESDSRGPKPVVARIEETPVRHRSRTPLWIGLGFLAAAGIAAVVWMFRPTAARVVEMKSSKDPVQLTADPSREEGPVFTREGDIRFIRFQGTVPVTFIMGADGSNQRRDASVPGLRLGLWSPDGKKVIFSKEGDDNDTKYLADSDGANEMKLPFPGGNMAWSTDGSKVVVQSGKTDSDIFVYTVASGEFTPLVSRAGYEADPSLSPDGNHVVFVSDRDGNAEIYIQHIDGSNLRRLTDHPAHDEFPTFSPDGTQIVFNSNRADENFDVYVMNVDGSGLRRLTDWPSDEEIRPNCWSADGTQILFVSSRDGKGNVYRMDAEPFAPVKVLRSEHHKLDAPDYSPAGDKLVYVSEADDKSAELHVVDLTTKNDSIILKSEVSDLHPSFSPDGRSIVFQHRLNGNAEICVISVDGGDIRNLTQDAARDILPAWSPDGSKIAFASNRNGNYDVFALYVVNADGTDPQRIYFDDAISSFPSWSPDGRTILFANDKEDLRTGNFEIFAIEPATASVEHRLTFRQKYDVDAHFSPDGSHIAFASNTDGNWEIYLMNPDGSGLLRLTRHLGSDTNPAWSPDGKRVIFSSDRDGRTALYEVTVD